MVRTWKGNEIANLSREVLNTNGAVKHADVKVNATARGGILEEKPNLRIIASGLKFASQRGLVERFDATIGAGSLLMPFGGKNQSTPEQAMAAKLEALSIVLPMAVGENDKLFGSVSAQVIADAVNAQGVELNKADVVLDENRRELGEYTVVVKLSSEVKANLKVTITKKED